jgi:hypothetical protein
MISKLWVALLILEGKGKVLLFSNLQVAQSENIVEGEFSLLFTKPDFNK